MKIIIRKWGNSQGIRLSREIMDTVNFSEDDDLEIEIGDGVISLKKAHQRKTLIELFEGYTGGYPVISGSMENEEIDFGTPMGSEVW